MKKEKNFNEILKYPTEQKVIGRWVSAFKNAGLTKIDIKYWEPRSIYPQKYYFEGIFPKMINILSIIKIFFLCYYNKNSSKFQSNGIKDFLFKKILMWISMTY